MVFTEGHRAVLHRALDDAFRRIEPAVAQPERNREIVSMRAAGVSFREIAEKFSISKQRAHMIWLRETGQPPTRRRARKVELQRSEAAAG